MTIQEKVNKYISEGKTKAEAINLTYDEKPKMQSGGTVDMYGNPINAPIQHKDIPRSFYDSRRGLINLGNDYKNMSPQQQEKVVAHENRHAWQYKNDRSNFEITHNSEFAFNERLQKKPNIINTDEIFNKYHDRQQKETDLELADFKKQNPQFSFMPNQILYDKGFSDGLYDNKFALEGEAQYYENTGQKSFQQGGTILKAQNGKEVPKYNSPEYAKAWREGKIQNKTADGDTEPYWGGQLDEITIQNHRKEKGFWEQSRDKYLKEHKDDGLLGAIGTVVTYPLAVGRDAMMYGTTGKVQNPSEAWGYNTKEGWFDSPSSFGKNLVDGTLNTVLDPANLVGAGVLTKENLLEKIAMSKESGLLAKGAYNKAVTSLENAGIRTSVAPELRGGVKSKWFWRIR